MFYLFQIDTGCKCKLYYPIKQINDRVKKLENFLTDNYFENRFNFLTLFLNKKKFIFYRDTDLYILLLFYFSLVNLILN